MSLSTYYYKSDKIEKEKIDKMIVKKIRKIIEKLPESGYRPITTILKRGMDINHKRVLRIMRENNLLCKQKPNKYKPKTTYTKHNLKKYQNLLIDFIPTTINQAIVGDITYYDINGMDYYLASLMDLYNREIIGWAVSDRINTQLCLNALKNAKRTRGSLSGCIHHTDSDVRYCSQEYIEKLEKYEMKISMCKGNVYENAHAESLNKTLKRQEINISEYFDLQHSNDSIKNFIYKYNTFRPHSSIGGLTPMELKNKMKMRNKK